MHQPQLTYDLETLMRHEPFVRTVLRSLVGDENKVQDLVQETWVRAMQNPPKKDRSPLGWLFHRIPQSCPGQPPE